MSRHAHLAAVGLLAAALASLAGCYSSSSGPPPMRSLIGGWVVTTALTRDVDPATAAIEAARTARERLGQAPARAVIFFECFGQIPAGQEITGSIRTVFPDAAIVGCSSAAVATAEGATGDRAVAMLVLGGAGGGVSTAYVPGAAASANEAGRQLARRLAAPSDRGAVILLADPATVQQFAWDPQELLAGLREGLSGASVVFGGVAARRGEAGLARIYHQDHGYVDGVVAMQISGPIDWAYSTRSELLPVGPLWQARKVSDYTVGELAAGSGSQPAETVVRRFLNAQERIDGHLGRVAGNRYVPLHFDLAADGAVKLPTKVALTERLMVLQSGTAEMRGQAVRAALADAAVPPQQLDGMPITLLAGPAGPGGRFVEEIGRIQQELARAGREHPAALGFLGDGQFAPITVNQAVSEFYCEHTWAALQLALRFTTAYRPTLPPPAE